MKNDSLNTVFNAGDIEKYFSGRLSPSEMHVIEKAALEDPFLAEAMEGYEAMENKEWQKELNGLKEKIMAMESTSKRAPVHRIFKWKSAAAAVLILCCGVALTYWLTHKPTVKNQTADIAITKKMSSPEQQTKHAIIADSITSTQTTLATGETNNSGNKISAKEHPGTSREKAYAHQHSDGNLLRKQRADSTASLAVTSTQPLENKAEPTSDLNKANTGLILNEEAATAKKVAAPENHFYADIITPDNTPLPFANVYVPQANFGTYADVKGKLRLVGADSIIKVEVRAAGYVPQTYTLKSGAAQNTIVLNEVSFADKDVVKFGNTKQRPAAPKTKVEMQRDTVMDVEPADGWNNYDTYLSNNLTTPKEVVKNNIHGEVEVSFDVQSNGMVNNVNIAKSLCGDCDQEALRIVKQGPQWKTKKGKKERGTVKVKF